MAIITPNLGLIKPEAGDLLDESITFGTNYDKMDDAYGALIDANTDFASMTKASPDLAPYGVGTSTQILLGGLVPSVAYRVRTYQMINFPSTNSKVSMFISTYISGGKIVWRQGSTVTISVGATIAFTNDNLAGSFIIISDGVQIPNPQGNLIVKMTVGSKSILAGPVLYTAKAMV